MSQETENSQKAKALATFLRETCGQSNIISVPRPILKMLDGDFAAALMLSQVIYWSERTTDPDGWFYKTNPEWEDEICLTREKIDRAAKVLEAFGVERIKRPVPGRGRSNAPVFHYRLNREVFEQRVVEFAQAQHETQPSDPASRCVKPAVKNTASRCVKPTLQGEGNPHLKVCETHTSPIPISASPTTSPTAAAETAPVSTPTTPLDTRPKPAAANVQKSSQDTPKALTEMTPNERSGLAPEVGLRKLREEMPDAAKRLRAKFEEIAHRPGIRSPRVIQWRETCLFLEEHDAERKRCQEDQARKVAVSPSQSYPRGFHEWMKLREAKASVAAAGSVGSVA